MRPRQIALVAALLAAGLLAPPRSAVAESDDTVVATVGNQKITAGDVQQRLRQVPAFQLKTYGKTPREVRKNFVEQVMIPEVLDAEEARRRKLDQKPEVVARINSVLRSTMMKALQKEVEKDHPISALELRRYYSAHKSKFDTPKRIRIWRILVADKAAAENVIKQVQGTGGPKRWTTLAHRSLDKATALRNGNLGFVLPDGQTRVPRVRVDPAVYAAADKVKDGEVVPQPVPEGKDWAVVWRRGSMPPVHRSLADETPSIRRVLERQRIQETVNDLLTKLENAHVTHRNDRLLQYVNVSDTGDVGAHERAGVLPRRPARGSPAPGQTENGLR